MSTTLQFCMPYLTDPLQPGDHSHPPRQRSPLAKGSSKSTHIYHSGNHGRDKTFIVHSVFVISNQFIKRTILQSHQLRQRPNGYTTQMSTYTEHNQPLRLLHMSFIRLRIPKAYPFWVSSDERASTISSDVLCLIKTQPWRVQGRRRKLPYSGGTRTQKIWWQRQR